MKNNIIIKNIFSSLIYQFTVIIYGLIIPILIIQTFGSETNGFVSSITQFISYISLLEVGIGPIIKNALFRPIVEKNEKKISEILGASNKIFKKIAYILVIYIVILCFVYPLINDSYSIIYTISLILIISIGQFSEYFFGMTYTIFLQAEQKNYVVDYINAFGYIVTFLFVVISINFGCSIQIVKLISSIVFVIKPIILKLYFDKNYAYYIEKNSNYKFEKQWDGLAHHIAASTQSNIDITILTFFDDLKNISIYSVYSLIIKAIRSIIVSLTNGIDAFFGKKMITDDKKNIKEKFSIYTFFFYTISTILIICTFILIVPFISVYTNGINDANYIQPLFAYILVFSEFNYIIRYPYSTIVYAKGHFKETKIFSIIEPIINGVLSTLLVFKYGLVGVAIGTFISMMIRSFGFIVYGTKNIINEDVKKSFKIIIISYSELFIFLILNLLIGNIEVNSYIEWLIIAIIIFVIVTIVVGTINCLFFKDIVSKIKTKLRKNDK